MDGLKRGSAAIVGVAESDLGEVADGGTHAMGAIGLGLCNVAVIAYGSTQRSVGRKQASVREVNHRDWTVPNHNFFDKPGLWFILYLLQENISLEARYNHVVERGHSSGRT